MSVSDEFPSLAYMLRYYHMNWPEDRRFRSSGAMHPDNVIFEFMNAERAELVASARLELESFLKIEHDDEQLDAVLYGLDANIRPAGRGLTNREWLLHVRELLTIKR